MNRDQHRAIAERLLSNLDASTADLLRAVAHAVLAGQPALLAYDAYAPSSQLHRDQETATTGGANS